MHDVSHYNATNVGQCVPFSSPPPWYGPTEDLKRASQTADIIAARKPRWPREGNLGGAWVVHLVKDSQNSAGFPKTGHPHKNKYEAQSTYQRDVPLLGGRQPHVGVSKTKESISASRVFRHSQKYAPQRWTLTPSLTYSCPDPERFAVASTSLPSVNTLRGAGLKPIRGPSLGFRRRLAPSILKSLDMEVYKPFGDYLGVCCWLGYRC